MRACALFTIATSLAFSMPAFGQAYRCTGSDGKVTYQQTPCPKASEERKVDTTPAASGDAQAAAAAREKLLREGAEASKRLEARTAEEDAERRRRDEERARDEQRERDAQAREAARDNPGNIYALPGWRPPSYPQPPYPTRPTPRPGTGTQPQPR